ncbi:hypothetical protein [Nocardia sp. N2S4-5]|uniref:hypothetical protein n=1 Tax=Nocardia sp. N2S4-5 TaxID=3351565 RepID=UPI0037CCD5E7
MRDDSDDDEQYDPATYQKAYYADLHFYDRHFPERAAALRAQGPPPPEAADGYWGKVAYHRHRAEAGDPESAEILEQLEAEGPPKGDERS